MKMERSIYTVMICHGIPEVDSKGKEPKKSASNITSQEEHRNTPQICSAYMTETMKEQQSRLNTQDHRSSVISIIFVYGVDRNSRKTK